MALNSCRGGEEERTGRNELGKGEEMVHAGFWNKYHLLHRLHLSLQTRKDGGGEGRGGGITFLSFKEVKIEFCSGENTNSPRMLERMVGMQFYHCSWNRRWGSLPTVGITVNPKLCWMKPHLTPKKVMDTVECSGRASLLNEWQLSQMKCSEGGQFPPSPLLTPFPPWEGSWIPVHLVRLVHVFSPHAWFWPLLFFSPSFYK